VFWPGPNRWRQECRARAEKPRALAHAEEKGDVMVKRSKTSVGRESALKCRTCRSGFGSAAGLAPCQKPTPGREYVDTGRGNHVFVAPAKEGPSKNHLRAHFFANLASIQSTIDILARDIDNLGELAFEITHDERCDQIGCYASNVLRGSQALLREMEGLV